MHPQNCKTDIKISLVRPSVSMEQLGFHWRDFHEIRYLNIFTKSVDRIPISFKSDKNNGYFIWRPIYMYDHISLDSSQNKEFRRNVVQEKKHAFKVQKLSFWKSRRFWHDAEKYGRTGQATDENIIWRM